MLRGRSCTSFAPCSLLHWRCELCCCMNAFSFTLRAIFLLCSKMSASQKCSYSRVIFLLFFHSFFLLFAVVQANWASLQAARTALDLHYVVKHVVEGMAATCDVKSGNVELADICKKILPIAGKFFVTLSLFFHLLRLLVPLQNVMHKFSVCLFQYSLCVCFPLHSSS